MTSIDFILLIGLALIEGMMIGIVLCNQFPDFFSVRTLMRVISPRGVTIETPAERQRRVRELWSNLAHDLRTPMTSVRGYLETALMRLEGNNSEIKPTLETALRNTESVIRLAEEMLALARLEERPTFKPVDKIELVELVYSIRDRCMPLAQKKGLLFEVHEPGNDLVIQGERLLIERAIENLVQNAIKYTATGGFVSVQLRSEAREVSIAVVDSGCGIPESEIPRVFDRFYRVEKDRSSQSRGFGLGLAITREVIVRHSGRIEIQSTVGSGTIATIILPRATIFSAGVSALTRSN